MDTLPNNFTHDEIVGFLLDTMYANDVSIGADIFCDGYSMFGKRVFENDFRQVLRNVYKFKSEQSLDELYLVFAHIQKHKQSFLNWVRLLYKW